MPQEWQKILDDNGITRAEQEQNPDKVLAVVQYFQNRDQPENQEEELWDKMRNAGPHGAESSPKIPSRDMSRENSRDAMPASFANPVSRSLVDANSADQQRAAPPPPMKSSGGSRIVVSFTLSPRSELTRKADRTPPPPPGRIPAELTKPARLAAGPADSTASILDRSASHRTPPTHPPKQKTLDRANTTRAPASKGSPPQALPMGKSHSQQGGQSRQQPAASQPVARQPTQSKGQQPAPTARRRDKQKENEEVIRQLQAICSPGDPNLVYRNLQKIGQG